MANPSPTRLSPAELRKRLLSPPTDTAFAPTPEEAAPAPVSRPSRREGSRYGSTATQAAIDLEALIADVGGPPANPRLTPMPDLRLEQMQFRAPQPQPEPMPSYAPAQQMQAPSHAQYENQQLRAQNAELHRIVEEMKPVLEEASASEQRFFDKENGFIAQISERDIKIGELAGSVKRLEEQLAAVPPPRIPKTRDELEEWSDELEKESAKISHERRRIDADRQQLREDEEALEKQMRDMEVAMARERAMIARQETELKRLSSEIQHELEVLQRGDGTLREQLSKFQRKHQEVLANAPSIIASPPIPVAPPAPTKKDSGLFRRIFRGGK
jgi:hypothetical protein